MQGRTVDPPVGLRARRRAHHLQGVGLHQPGLRLQSPDRQRRDFVRTHHRPEPEVTLATVRAPVASGRFYPEAADELERTVRDLLAPLRSFSHPAAARAALAPHAGYLYS